MRQKRRFSRILHIAILVIFVCIFILGLSVIIHMVAALSYADEELLCSSTSPDKKIVIEIYRLDPGATIDYSIKAYMLTDGTKKLIYNAYHERSVDVQWVGNDIVSINGKQLDLSAGETYDWRKKR